MKTSRQRLLEYIQQHRYVTVAELSRVLRMSRANARHHLSILEQQGLIVVIGERPAEQGRGRPALLYGLAETVQAHSLDKLADVLLTMLVGPPAGLSPALPSVEPLTDTIAEAPSDERAGLYRQVASSLRNTACRGSNGQRGNASPVKPAPTVETARPTSLTQRLATTVQNLNQLNYQARWEAHAQGPRLIIGHCPYAAILKDHPEMCQIDRHLLQELSGVEVVQTGRLIPDERGVPFCRFVLQSR